MLIRTADYYPRFRCLAGACPHTCCAGWEVEVDEDTACRYFEVPGPLGDKLRASLRHDGDGGFCFPLSGGRCPFLDGEDLCEIHRQLGEAATSVTCREHPRFTEDYGPFREITLSAACPAANALLLGDAGPLTFREEETAEPGEDGDPWLSWLVPLRARLLDLVRDRRRPLKRRLADCLSLAWEAQLLLENEETDALEALALGDETPPLWTADPAGLFPAGLRFLGTLEALEPDWRDLLARAEAGAPGAVPEAALERMAAYFLFRYPLKAVNDGDLLGRVELCVFAVLAVEHLAAVCGPAEALRRFSREIEHNEDHLEALLAAFRQREELGFRRFFHDLSV